MTEEKKQEISDSVIKDDCGGNCQECRNSRLIDRQRELIARLRAEIAALKGEQC